ncbi:hypothetical protein V5O48_012420, partial [Marasmius crinis-equi]
GVQNVSIGDNGNFSTVHGNQHNVYHFHTVTEALVKKKKFIIGTEEEEAEYEQFPEIKRADFVAIRNIFCSDGWLYDFEQKEYVKGGERMVVAGNVRIGGVGSKCTVVQYSGQEAGEDQMGCYWSHSLWLDTSRGVFCRGPKGPYCYIDEDHFDFEDLPLDAELVKEDVLFRYLANKNQDRKVVRGLSLPRDSGGPTPLKVNWPAVISTLTDTILAVRSGVWKEEWSCLGEREELANGATRFTLDHDGRDLELYFQGRGEAIDDWLAQAPSIFHAHGIPLEGDMYKYGLVLPDTLRGTLSESEVKGRRREDSPTIYLFIPPLSTSTFWSCDPDGQKPFTIDLCHYLGLPVSLSLGYISCHWPAEVYKAMQAYQIARGFNPDTTEFARHNQYRIFEITDQLLPSRFREIKDPEERQSEDFVVPSMTSLRSVHQEEAPDLAATATTPRQALQNGVKYPSNYPHSSPAAIFSASTDFPCVNTTEINCTLPRDPKSVFPSAETSSRAHSKDSKTVPAEIEDASPRPPQHAPTDIILSISSFKVQTILCQKSTPYEFQSNQSTSPPPSFNRVWFYVAAPESSISYVGTTAPTDGKTKEKGKTKASDCTISFPIESLYRLRQPLTFSTLKQRFGIKSAPRVGTILPVPTSMLEAVPWQTQHLVWPLRTQSSGPAAKSVVARKQVEKKAEVKRKAWR